MTFFVPQEDLVAGLRALAPRVCSYTAQPCDCKYGAHLPRARIGSENGSGCPECLSAAEILAALTPAEYERAIRRATRATAPALGSATALREQEELALAAGG